MGLSSHLLKMKLIVASLLLVALVSAQDSRSVRERVKGQVRQWASIQAHCAEASNTEGSIQPEVALQCKKCQAGVGDWNTAEGFQRGKACLETYEPKTMAVCGDLFQEYEDSGYDVSYTSKMVECWENTYMRDIAGKCMEATGGEGVDGFMNFYSSAQNLTMAWVTDKRPEAIDMMSAYMRGGMIMMGDDEP